MITTNPPTEKSVRIESAVLRLTWILRLLVVALLWVVRRGRWQLVRPLLIESPVWQHRTYAKTYSLL
jgi:hypothetical protein